MLILHTYIHMLWKCLRQVIERFLEVAGICLCLYDNDLTGIRYCNVLGVLYSRWNFIALQKVNTLQLNTARNSSNTRTRPTCTVSEHWLTFLQSESLQTHVGTIHRRAIGPLAHHNGTSAYSPSLTCHLPAPTHKHVYPRTILKPHSRMSSPSTV
jgi:hypothetical protein